MTLEGSPSLFIPFRWSSQRLGVWEVWRAGAGGSQSGEEGGKDQRGGPGLWGATGEWQGAGAAATGWFPAPGSRRPQVHTSPRPDAPRPPSGDPQDPGLRGTMSPLSPPPPETSLAPQPPGSDAARWRRDSRASGAGMTQSGAGHEAPRPPAPAEARPLPVPPPCPAGGASPERVPAIYRRRGAGAAGGGLWGCRVPGCCGAGGGGLLLPGGIPRVCFPAPPPRQGRSGGTGP